MTLCKDCRHPQANHHNHIGSCAYTSAFFLSCTCPTFQPDHPFHESPVTSAGSVHHEQGAL